MPTGIDQSISYIIGGGIVAVIGWAVVNMARALVINPVRSAVDVVKNELENKIDVNTQRLTDYMSFVNDVLILTKSDLKEGLSELQKKTSISLERIRVNETRIEKINQEIKDLENCCQKIKENCRGDCKR